MKGWTYILECSDGSYYVGSTDNLTRRLAEHQAGIGSKYTSRRLPVKLKFSKEFDRIDEAFYYEHKIKKWSRAKKEALIEGRYHDLPKLAKKLFKKDR